MSDVVTFGKQNSVGIITTDNPPVNALSQAVREGLAEAMAAAAADDEVKAIVLLCEGRTFFAGADIKEFGKPPVRPYLPEVQDAFEASSKPVVAAIHGNALGGGLETAMACHYRVAVPSARVGQPEVKLGIIPGAGGTQRLPRLVGVEKALEMIVWGNPVNAAAAHAAGLIDELVDEGDLGGGAIAFAERLIDEGAPLRKARDIDLSPDSLPGGIFDEYRKAAAKKLRGQKAPEVCIQAVEAAVELPFDEAIALERKLFDECVNSAQSAALRHAFFAERQTAKIPDVPKDTPLRPIETVGIVGAGTMGGGIAMSFANVGIPVTILEVEREALDQGLGVVGKNYSNTVKKGRLSQEKMDECMGLIRGTLDYADLSEVDLVIEAVFEDMDVKKKVFAKLDGTCKAGAILATNTSTLDVDEIATATSRPEDVLGLHFFSPANVMRLLEVVRAKKTAKDVLATCTAAAKRIRKVPVVSGVCFGFIANRMLLGGYIKESRQLAYEGAPPHQIDKALYDFGMPMGPYAIMDLAGLDVGYLVRKGSPHLSEEEKIDNVVDPLVESGRLGQKTGRGYYIYESGSRTPTPDPEVDELIRKEAERLGIQPREINDDEITERCIFPLINEGARILEEGIALRPGDIDIVWLYGFGFPPYRGGPMHYADAVGVDKVYEAICGYREAFGADHWTPAPLLEKLARQHQSFASLG